MLILSATMQSAGALHGHFTDAGAIAQGIGVHLGAGAGVVFAIALLNASLLGACVVSLSGCYAIGEVFGIKHSLHRGWRDATTFHATFAAIVALAVGIVLLPGLPLGAVTTLVQAFAGILLPSTLVLLLILCNDEHLLGPLTNGRWLDATAGTAVALVLGLSTLLTITTVLPGVDVETRLLTTGALLALAGLTLTTSWLRHRRPRRSPRLLTPWQRRTWSSPTLELVKPASPTRPRLLALALLRGYVMVIAGLLLLKLAGLLPA